MVNPSLFRLFIFNVPFLTRSFARLLIRSFINVATVCSFVRSHTHLVSWPLVYFSVAELCALTFSLRASLHLCFPPLLLAHSLPHVRTLLSWPRPDDSVGHSQVQTVLLVTLSVSHSLAHLLAYPWARSFAPSYRNPHIVYLACSSIR